MNTNGDDSGLRQRFQALKKQDRELAPDFDVRPERRGVWAMNYRVAAAAVVVILLAGFAVTRFLDRAGHSELSIAQISNWHSPTESLLETPGSELLETLPRFGGDISKSEVQ